MFVVKDYITEFSKNSIVLRMFDGLGPSGGQSEKRLLLTFNDVVTYHTNNTMKNVKARCVEMVDNMQSS